MDIGISSGVDHRLNTEFKIPKGLKPVTNPLHMPIWAEMFVLILILSLWLGGFLGGGWDEVALQVQEPGLGCGGVERHII